MKMIDGVLYVLIGCFFFSKYCWGFVQGFFGLVNIFFSYDEGRLLISYSCNFYEKLFLVNEFLF